MAQVTLMDYSGEKFQVEIPDETESIVIDIISGDMVMTSPVFFDTGRASRWQDFFDGSTVIRKDDFQRLETIEKSYDIFDF